MSFLNQLRSLANSQEQNILASRKQVIAVNIILGEARIDRDLKLAILEYWFGREFETSKQMTSAEASAILNMSYKETETHRIVDVDFIKFIQGYRQYDYEF